MCVYLNVPWTGNELITGAEPVADVACNARAWGRECFLKWIWLVR